MSPTSPSSDPPRIHHHVQELHVDTPGEGMHECTDRVIGVVRAARVRIGTCTVFVRHTSASLVIQENADPSARHDLEQWLARLVPPGDPRWTHTAEGPDDMPSHVRSALTATSLVIPVVDGRLVLGTWQGLYLWEHRRRPHARRLVVMVAGEADTTGGA